MLICVFLIFFFQAEDGIRDLTVTGVQTCALPISPEHLVLELELEHEVLRRLDPKTPRELRHGRGSRVRHLGGILTAKEDQWLPCNCGRWRWERSSTPPSRCSAATPASSSASRSCVRVCRLD